MLHYPEYLGFILSGPGVLIYGGATHNFIDAAWVSKRGISTEKFGGFTIEVAGNLP